MSPDGLTILSQALADDDDDDDRDDDDDDDDEDDDDDRPARAEPRQAAPAPLPQRAPDEIIVRGLSQADLAQLLSEGFEQIDRRDLAQGGSLQRLRKPARLSLEDARDVVRARATAARADFNHYYRTEEAAVPVADSCPGGLCLARQVIGWQAPSGCGDLPRIGMVDTGVNAGHETFAGARLQLHSLDPATTSAAPSDALHGTAVAALLVGAPGSRSPGLVPGAELVAVDAFVRAGEDQRSDALTLIAALDWLGAQDLRLINLSLAGPPNDELARQIEALALQDILVVAAAGNLGPRAAPAYPAAYDSVLAVTAVDRRKQVYRRAGRGAHIDLSAPGVEVWTAASIRGARTKTGTSYAAPFATAAAALWLQAEPGLSSADLMARITGSADDLGAPGRDPIFGAGLLTAPPACPTAPAQDLPAAVPGGSARN
ncbi:peptidase S8/S53 subtilisin kexin sedolisin [Paracoccus liaowanqingii]|uniref:Peptidase S8/S53 subtilisin kexin sedolisin n=2 Tax=Paracoccus liaowanqingii TaxID=2560053 RepID=A0A4P7HP32_9RHOB|nr:peptidase S8/S53 subtilisin kexin sedolisin [Paracoccus liaowanqingii]